MTTTATIHNPDRREFWLKTLGTDTAPIRSVIPTWADLPGKPTSLVYILDTQALSEQQQESLLAALCQGFDLPVNDETRCEFLEKGVPVLAEDVTVTSNDFGLLYSLMDDEDEGRSTCKSCGNQFAVAELTPDGFCDGCARVQADYGYYDDYDEFDDDDEYGRTYTCETCGGEYGDGWSTCICDDDEPTCRVCGCTDEFGCPGGCYWVEPDLCSRCVGKTAVSVFIDPPANQANCDHVWDGPFIAEEGMSTATCSKCGMWAIDYWMWFGP